jgi:diacylglycerol kinase
VSVKSQCNLRIHIIAAIIAIILGFILRISVQEWLIISIVIGSVISAEMFNTSIEAIVDIISPEYSENAKKAKDISAGAVLILAIVAVVVGIIIFVPKIILVINQ